MSQINLEEKISEKIRFDYRERLKKIQGDIKNNKSISRIDEIYLKKVLDLESLPDDFVKKNDALRKMDVYNKDKPRIINKIIDEQTEKSLKDNLYNDKLKAEVEILKEENKIINNQKQKFDQQIDEYKVEKEEKITNLKSQLNNIKTQMTTEKSNVEKQESDINELALHYQNTISDINNSISTAKKEYDDVIKKRESLMHEMQSLKKNYDIATKLKTESEQDLTSEKNLQLIKANKIQESTEQILQQNRSLNEQIENLVQKRNKNSQQTREVQGKITKQDSLLKTIKIILSHVEAQKSLAHDLLNANQSYDRVFDEKMIAITNMKNLIKNDLELLTKNIQK